MKYKSWESSFELGISALDKDHQNLFDGIKKLGDAIHGDKPEQAIAATLNALLLYVNEHFEREERFMLRSGYPDFKAHKEQHDAFRDGIFSLQDYHKEHPKGVDAQKVVRFLENWLEHHILKVDKDYAPYLTGEKKGNPDDIKDHKKLAEETQVQLICPASKKDQVINFIKLIDDGSEEGALIEAAVAKITALQSKRRREKAKSLFGK